MFRSKRDVDRHVEQLESKIQSETDKNLMALSISKLYFKVGELDLAKKYVVKFLTIKDNSANGHKLLGQILEAQKLMEKAVQSYKNAYEYDQNQKDLILKICEILAATNLAKEEPERTRYWLELGVKFFPHNHFVTKLEAIINGEEIPFNGHNGKDSHSLDNSPQEFRQHNLDDSILSSAVGTGFLNGSRLRGQGVQSLGTPDRSSTPSTSRLDRGDYSAQRKYVPRPSPERLAAQVNNLELSHEKMAELIVSHNRIIVDEFKNHSSAALQDTKHFHQSMVEEMKMQRQAMIELKMEIKQGMYDVKLEVNKLGQVQSNLHRELKDIISTLPKRIGDAIPAPQVQVPVASGSSANISPTPPGGAKPLGLSDLQEALAQQTALLQMSSLGFAAQMFARPPMAPAANAPVGAMPPLHPGPGSNLALWNQLGSQQPVGGVGASIGGVQVPTMEPKTEENISTPKSTNFAENVNVPHDYQIKLPDATPVTTSPFKEKDGPAVSIVTSSLLSHVPSPTFSSLSKTPISSSPSISGSKPTVSAASTSSEKLFDKFKPKEGSWECQSCMLRNDGDVIQCKACESAKPGHEEEVKKKQELAKPKITMGAQGGFKFGIGTSQTVTSITATTVSSSPFAFSSNQMTTSAAPTTVSSSPFGFNSGQMTASTATTTVSSSPFSFSSFGAASAKSFGAEPADKGMGFTFGAKTSQTVLSDNGNHLSFENKALKLDTEEDAKEIATKISSFKNMKKLTFSGNTFGIDACKTIGKSLESHPEFTHAHWKDMFTSRMKTEIPPALEHLSNGIMKANAHLVELDLSDNAFGPIGMKGIVDLLKSPSCYTLQVLRLNNTGCGVTGGKVLAQNLMECFQSSKKAGKPLALKVFVLGRSRQENDGAKALAKVFKVMGSLEEIIMPQNGIYHEGIKALTNAFANNPNLHTINMNDNTFTERGAGYLAEVLPKLQKLAYLNIGDCLIKTEGAKLIANALKSGHNHLEELHMDSNEIGLEGGEAIVQCVASKPSMKKLYIGTNCFGQSGCEKLIALLGNKSELVGGEIEDDEGDLEDEGESEDEVEPEEEVEPEDEDEEEQNQDDHNESPQPSSSVLQSQGVDLSAGKTGLQSFASVASSFSGFSFGTSPNTTFSFANAGSQLFQSQQQPNPGNDAGDNELVPEDPNHDPHFEPVIPLPEIVAVSTGEEDEDVVFKYRSKVYRYDIDTKEWKERGVGDLKILKHKTENVFRVLLRRDQTHKIAINHKITPEMVLKPMSGSETALCWFAMDFAEGELQREHLAAKFKLADTKADFQKKFEECQDLLRKESSDQKDSKPSSSVSQKSAITPQPSSVTPKPSSDIPIPSSGTPKPSSGTPKPSLSTPHSQGVDLSAGKTGLQSFASVASSTLSGFSFGTSPNTTFSFANAGSQLFQSQQQPNPGNDAGDNELVPEDPNHDPHFEPVIPLPEIVAVSTGEEDEDVVFKYRSKVYRYDIDTKEWKERGVGDLKILKHKTKKVFRVLLRRDQTHKIAINHKITPEMVLKPMSGSETALCWFAMDFAEGELQKEHLAAKFKLADTKADFQKKFEECQEQLRNSEPDTHEEEDIGEEDEEDEESVMFEKSCYLFEKAKDETSESLGEVDLRIIYDVDVYGARIVAYYEDGEQACNHLIAIQTTLTEEDEKLAWSALDFSIDPPTYRSFEATFKSPEDMQSFKESFYDGKELAEQSEILELPQDPLEHPIYHGQGNDYDENTA